jgi:hypothetical protein
VNYADDFVILSRRKAAEALDWTRGVMSRIGLTLNEAKTHIRQANSERFDFLGYTFGPHRIRKDGSVYLGMSPSKKSVDQTSAESGRPAGARECEAMAGGAESPQCNTLRSGGLLPGLSGRQSPRL